MMNTIIPPPAVHPEPIVEPHAGSDASWLSRLSTRRYRLLLLLLCTAAATLASEGMQRLAALRANYYLAIDRGGAVSPVSHGARLPALHALASAAPGDVRAVVRADSAGEGSAALCALAAELKDDPGVVWIAAAGPVEACMQTSLNGRIVPVAATARTELARARWVLLDRDGAALHSGRTVPTSRDVREIAGLVSPATPGPAVP